MKDREILEGQFEMARGYFFHDTDKLRKETDIEKRLVLWGIIDQDLDEANRIKEEIEELEV